MTTRSLPQAPPPARGRGSQTNPANRFESVEVTPDGDHLDALHADHPRGRRVDTELLPDRTRSVINPVDSPDLAFRWTLNPYRGCEHGCSYCYARPTHEYLGLSSGLDFETRLFAKHDAPALLRRELGRPGWRGEPIVMSGITDPYQPVEAALRITRSCLEVMAECRQPVGIVTKNRLVVRDADLLADLAAHGAARVALSLTTLDHRLAAAMEPRASSPRDRLRAMQTLAERGIPVVAMIAPVIPGLNDREIPALLAAARDAGARFAGWVLLRLPWQNRDLFLAWLHRAVPERASRIEGLIRSTRGGGLYESAWSRRRRGRGPFADQIARTMQVFRRRHGLDAPPPPLRADAFRRPEAPGQLRLFDAVPPAPADEPP